MKATIVRKSKTKFRQLHALTVIVISLCAASQFTFAAKLYKWVDAEGNVSYQDQPPPSNGKIIKESELITSSVDSDTENALAPVIIYTIEDCDSCEVMKLRLEQLSIPFEEQSLLSREVQRSILAQSDSVSAPTLYFNEKYMSGLKDEELIAELRLGGYEPSVADQQLEVIDPDDVLENNEDGDVLTDEQLSQE